MLYKVLMHMLCCFAFSAIGLISAVSLPLIPCVYLGVKNKLNN